MSENKQIEILLKNIQQGLKKYSIKELNDAINTFLNSKDDKTEEIEYVFQIVCKEFETSYRKLKTSNVRGILNEAKQIIYCIMYFEIGLSIRHISYKIFSHQNHSSVYLATRKLKSCDLNIKQDREFLERYNKVKEAYLDKFSQQQKNTYEH